MDGSKPATTLLKILVAFYFLFDLLLLGLGVLFIIGGVSVLETLKGYGLYGALLDFAGGLLAYIGIVLVITAIIGFAITFYLWKRNKFAYFLVLVSSAMSVLSVVVGNIPGLIGLVPIYILWFHQPTKELFS
ncbi:hypothetical protein J4450_02130 [Candidatus Micrarchaeota archaeon]|nr:hypothetical protein [Candidatus Micrarchaeota archaeon]